MLRNITVGKATIFSRQAGQRVLLVIGVAFIGALIVKSWDELELLLKNTDPFLFFISILLAFMGNLFTAMLLHALFKKFGIDVGIRKAILLFFWSQVTKYIPGKIWPIVYQVTALNRATSTVIVSNINMMVAAIITTAAISIALILISTGWIYPLMVMIVGLIACVSVCGTYWWALLMRVSVRVLPRRYVSLPHCPGKVSLLVVFVYYAGFTLTYAISGTVMLSAVFGLPGEEAIYFVGYQGFAWITGVVAFIVPAGMGVRELAFIWLGAGVSKTASAELIMAMAIVFRMWYIVQEIFGAMFAAGWNVIAVADERTEHD